LDQEWGYAKINNIEYNCTPMGTGRIYPYEGKETSYIDEAFTLTTILTREYYLYANPTVLDQ
jgi:hypothetical protein